MAINSIVLQLNSTPAVQKICLDQKFQSFEGGRSSTMENATKAPSQRFKFKNIS